MQETPRKDKRIIEEAAAWATLLDDGELSAGDSERLAAWLRESPQHVKELLLAKAILTEAESIDPDRVISVDDLLADHGAEIFSFEPTPETPAPAPIRRIGGRAISIAASLFTVAVAATFLAMSPFSPFDVNQIQTVDYTTAIGEQRSLSLDDGSIIHLNTLSTISVKYDKGERAINLVDGEALFDVAHDPDRPFRVYAGGTVAEAIGTTFNVRRIGNDAEVAVLEGKVTVTVADSEASRGLVEPEPSTAAASPTGGNSITLAVGESATVDASGSLHAVPSRDLDAVAAWRMRKLVFEDAPLAEIAGEFNRYNRTKMRIQGDETVSPRFSGVFDADDPDAFLSILQVSGTARIDRVDQDRVIVHLTPTGNVD